MNNKEQIIYQSIVRGMREGVFTVDRSGHITSINPAATVILGKGDDIVGKTFAEVFFGEDAQNENDEFCEAILSAVYQNSTMHNEVVNYRIGQEIKQLFMSTSYLSSGDEKIGITVVINDITELNELRDAVKAMEKIRALNVELEKRNSFIKKTFGRYLSDEIVSTILETSDGLEIGGKKQDVTVMFSDIRGFTALSERMAPHDLITMLNNYLEHMIEIIISHKGTILEFIGDAIVAVFGAPLESQTKNFDAVACAIDMQNEMAEVNAFGKDRGYPAIEMGIGIHCGDVVLGNIGSSKKTKYDIIGKNVNLASRIETYTVGGQILISEDIKSTLADDLTVGKTLEVMPKGVKNPIPVYEVRALGERIMPDNSQRFTELVPPLEITFFILDGKHTSSVGHRALICSISEKEFYLESEEELGDNMTISFGVSGNEIYAKVIGHKNAKALLHITSGESKDITKSYEK